GGQRVDETRRYLEGLLGKKVQLNIKEVQQPELNAYLVARNIAEQLERRIAYRRAMKQTMMRSLQAGAKGVKVSCSGRLAGAEIARRLTMHEGQVPLHTMRADIDYSLVEARTTMGRIGVKVWINKGEVLPEIKVATLFCSGTTDGFGTADELRGAAELVSGARLHLMEAADHGFSPAKGSGRTRPDIYAEAIGAAVDFFDDLAPGDRAT
ncbi:MAG: 30S ribosomal protein S3, partial [Chloroflexi bacterium]|nr:30S ribosomal protein S3 [Chloroflexota bacterium]